MVGKGRVCLHRAIAGTIITHRQSSSQRPCPNSVLSFNSYSARCSSKGAIAPCILPCKTTLCLLGFSRSICRALEGMALQGEASLGAVEAASALSAHSSLGL